MENKINIAELLKDCPEGMDLDCAMYDNVQFDIVQDGNAFPIKINTPEGRISLSKYGCYSLNPQCKCVIFPKGETTWEGFVPPRKYRDGDIEWQTGTPEQSGRYLVTLSTGKVTAMEFYNPYTSPPYWLDKEEEEGEVVAWCDMASIEPYKLS